MSVDRTENKNGRKGLAQVGYCLKYLMSFLRPYKAIRFPAGFAGKRISGLIFVSLSCSFRLLLSSYGRFFVKFLLAKIADNAVARALSLEAAKRAFNVFVLSDFYRGHSVLTFLCLCVYFLRV